jgi:hypothetical protein
LSGTDSQLSGDTDPGDTLLACSPCEATA